MKMNQTRTILAPTKGPSNRVNPTHRLLAAGSRLLCMAAGLLCLTSAAFKSFAAGSIAIESIAFSKNPAANNGQMFVTIRNNGPTVDSISAIRLNGYSIGQILSGTGEWYRYDRPTLAPGGVSVLTIKGTGTSGPISPGTIVTVGLTAASGAAASSSTTLTHQLLRLAYIVASQDMQTLYIFVENRDTVNYTVTQVFLDNDVTANCTFVGGTTIAPGTVGIIKANMGSPVPLLTPYSVRVLANKSGSGSIETASPIRIRRPYIPNLIWAGTGEDNYDVYRGPDKSWDLECLREANIDSLWHNCNTFWQLASYDQRYKMGSLTHINQFNQPYLDFQYSVLPNRQAPYIWGWVIDSEPELHADRPPKAQNIWNDQYWQTNLIAGTYVDNPQQARMNEFRFTDMHGFDNYPSMTSLQTVRDYMDAVMDNCEPFTGMSHNLLGDPGQSTTAKDFGVNDEFWFPAFSGSKGILWYGYRGTGTSSTGGAYQAPTSKYYTNFMMMRHCNREFVQIRNLMLYSPRGLTNANYSGLGAITMSGGEAPAKWQAKMMVSEEAVVMGLINWNVATTTSPITDQTGCSVAFTLPPWIPVEQVYEVTPTGKAACSYTVSGQRVTISGITIRDSKIYVAGKNDTTPPTAPTELTIARQTNSIGALSWRESWDNYGVMGYRVYSNGVQVADVQCPIWTNSPQPAVGAIYTVKAYDSALNLSAASTSYEVSDTNLIGRWFAGAETLADVSGYTPAGTHDGVIVGANPEALAYSDDVPPGQTGKSLDLTANGAGKQVGVVITNSSTRDSSYRPTFDDDIRYGLQVSFYYKGDFAYYEGPVGKRGVEGVGDYWVPDDTTGWGIRKAGGAGQLSWTIRSQQAYTNFDGLCTGGTPFDGNWHKVEAVWNGQTGVRQCYLDGALVLNQGSAIGALADMFGGLQLASPNHVGIGVRESVDARSFWEWYPRYGTNFAYPGWYNGKIYDVRIYKQSQLTQKTAVARADNVASPGGTVRLRIPAAALLANDVDPGYASLTITNVSASSARGGSVTLSGNWILYTPPPGSPVSDSFTYTWFSRYLGAPVSGTVTVNPPSAGTGSTQTITGITTNSDGSVTISFAGIPSQTYVIQAATNPAAPVWVPIGTNTAGRNGLFQFTDVDAVQYPGRIYRTATP